MNVYAKFRCAPLRIKKALGIFRELITTTTTTSIAIGDPPNNNNDKDIPHISLAVWIVSYAELFNTTVSNIKYQIYYICIY